MSRVGRRSAVSLRLAPPFTVGNGSSDSTSVKSITLRRLDRLGGPAAKSKKALWKVPVEKATGLGALIAVKRPF